MDGYIKVIKGTIETTIRSSLQAHYEKHGWSLVEQKEVVKPQTYNVYTKKQLIDIAKNRNLLLKERDTKISMIDKLVELDKQENELSNKPSNKGFTDNLIIK